LLIFDIDDKGRGVAKKNDRVVFVEGAGLGERILAEITTERKNYFLGRNIETLESSPDAIDAACPYADSCDGCSFQKISYEREVQWKKEKISNALLRIGGVEPGDIPFFKSPQIYHYRNKISMRLSSDNQLSFYNRGTHSPVPVKSCVLAAPAINDAISAMNRLLKKIDLTAEEKADQNPIEEIVFRSNAKGDLLLHLTFHTNRLKQKDKLVEELKKIPRLHTLVLTWTVRKGRKVTKRNEKIVGSGTLHDTIESFQFDIPYDAFFQVNPFMTPTLYRQAQDAISATKQETLLDLYCGIGTFTSYIARDVKKAVGVEINANAAAIASENAEKNRIKNTFFYHGKAEDLLPKLLLEEDPALVTVDPARSGLNKRVVETLGDSNVSKICYISCNPATLARDIKRLTKKGYSVKKVVGVDMFPRTTHVETVVLMSRKG
jgi:23S rRNA (uracil1939-C5)-methyltransferase